MKSQCPDTGSRTNFCLSSVDDDHHVMGLIEVFRRNEHDHPVLCTVLFIDPGNTRVRLSLLPDDAADYQTSATHNNGWLVGCCRAVFFLFGVSPRQSSADAMPVHWIERGPPKGLTGLRLGISSHFFWLSSQGYRHMQP